MKSTLQSIKPKWCAEILNGKKTIEVRTTAPKDWLDYLSGKTKVKPEPSTVYIYCTKDKNNTAVNMQMFFDGKDFIRNGKVVAKFTLRKVEDLRFLNSSDGFAMLGRSCLQYEDFIDYLYKGKPGAFGWHISDLEIFGKPRELGEFGLERAPQSWAYIRED